MTCDEGKATVGLLKSVVSRKLKHPSIRMPGSRVLPTSEQVCRRAGARRFVRPKVTIPCVRARCAAACGLKRAEDFEDR